MIDTPRDGAVRNKCRRKPSFGQSVGIVGTGHYVPRREVTNADMAQMGLLDEVDKPVRTAGIAARRWAATDELTSDLAAKAGRIALLRSRLPMDRIGMVLLASSTPDKPMPATATRVQHLLGLSHAGAVDVDSVCSSWCNALALARGLVACGDQEYVLVIGADTYSKILDFKYRRGSGFFFGDGAGAVIVGPTRQPGLLCSYSRSDGSGYSVIERRVGGVMTPATPENLRYREGECLDPTKFSMDGKAVYEFGIRVLPEAVRSVLEVNGLLVRDVDWLIPHQANLRMIRQAAEQLELNPDRVAVTVDRYANTAAASVPLTLAELTAEGKVHPGQLIVTVAFGGGLAWAANAFYATPEMIYGYTGASHTVRVAGQA